MSDTPKRAFPEIAPGQSDPDVTHNESLRRIEMLVLPNVIDKDMTSPPGSPSDGDAYLLAGTGLTGDWAGQENDLTAFKSSAWIFQTPQGGDRIYVQDEGVFYEFDDSNSPGEWTEIGDPSAYDVEVSVEGQPGAGDVVKRICMVRTVTFADDFSGSQADSDTNSSDSGGAVFDIQKNGASVGSVTFDGSSMTFVSDSGGVTFVPGDVLTVVAPNPQDSTLADVSVTLKGSQTG